MLESINKCLIIEHRFVVTFFFFLDLLEEKLLLCEGIIQLGIRVAELMMVNKQLKPLSDPRLRTMILRQRRHQLRMLGDKGRVKALSLQEMPHKLINQTRGGARIRASHMMKVALLIKELGCIIS